jgi:hypothetical protein
MECIEKDTSSTDPDKWPVCELLILLLFFSVEWLFSLFVLVQLLKCCEHRGTIGSPEGGGVGEPSVPPFGSPVSFICA